MASPHNSKLPILKMEVLPAFVALATVCFEPALSAWSQGRVAALPLATVLLLSALMHPRLRHLLMITLCYGVSFLALRDIVRQPQMTLPPPLNYQEWEVARAVDLLLVAVLSAAAAISETIRPGTVWARRCYFGAAGFYFFGLGIVTYFHSTSWQSILLMVTGVTALVGCIFAHRIVATEMAEVLETSTQSDEVFQQTRDKAHRTALQAKEWRDSLVGVIDERDTPSTGQA